MTGDGFYVTVGFGGGSVCVLDRHVVTFLNVMTMWLDLTTDRLKFIGRAELN